MLLPTEAEIVTADFEDVNSLTTGLKDIDYLYLDMSLTGLDISSRQ